MTKSQLIELLSARHSQLAPKDAELAVKTMLDAMALTLASGNRIEIRGFGSFGLNYRPPRTGRNPKTGEKVQVPRKYVPHFKAGKELRERGDYHEGWGRFLSRSFKRRADAPPFFYVKSFHHGGHGGHGGFAQSTQAI